MIRLLAIDTTGPFCAVALLEGGQVSARLVEEMARGQAERLFPMISDLFAASDASQDTLATLDAIAVATGPGNFTGVRIGVSAARGLALARDIPVWGVSTLAALAHGVDAPVLVTLDARNGGLYAQSFDHGRPLTAPFLVPEGDLPDPGSAGAVRGYGADRIADALDLALIDTQTVPAPEVFGLIAQDPEGARTAPAAPLYIRAADAALPREAPPQIVA